MAAWGRGVRYGAGGLGARRGERMGEDGMAGAVGGNTIVLIPRTRTR